MVIDIVELDRLVHERLIHRVDHKHLNLDVDFMSGVIPTAENIVYCFWQELEPGLSGPVRLHRLRLFESKNNVAEYQGETAGS
jgi:6-pyruvoyltetrahydropterin/6-carboxytetrahydropterin synthase